MEDVIKTRVEEGAFLVTGKVMYGRSELEFALNNLLMFDIFTGGVDWLIVKDIFSMEILCFM